jgi:hypothetical protein
VLLCNQTEQSRQFQIGEGLHPFHKLGNLHCKLFCISGMDRPPPGAWLAAPATRRFPVFLKCCGC